MIRRLRRKGINITIATVVFVVIIIVIIVVIIIIIITCRRWIGRPAGWVTTAAAALVSNLIQVVQKWIFPIL